MKASNEFDMVFDCQAVFKDFMNAMARPGTIFNIREQAEKLECEKGTLLAGALTFLDSRCGCFVCGEEELREQIQEYTMAKDVKPDEADMILVPAGSGKEKIRELMEKGKSGTLAEPHKSATFLIEVDALGDSCKEEAVSVTLQGPGIDKEIRIIVPETCLEWMEERDRQMYEFPCGVDLVFCTGDGQIMGIPRTTKIKEGGER